MYNIHTHTRILCCPFICFIWTKYIMLRIHTIIFPDTTIVFPCLSMIFDVFFLEEENSPASKRSTKLSISLPLRDTRSAVYIRCTVAHQNVSSKTPIGSCRLRIWRLNWSISLGKSLGSHCLQAWLSHLLRRDKKYSNPCYGCWKNAGFLSMLS